MTFTTEECAVLLALAFCCTFELREERHDGALDEMHSSFESFSFYPLLTASPSPEMKDACEAKLQCFLRYFASRASASEEVGTVKFHRHSHNTAAGTPLPSFEESKSPIVLGPEGSAITVVEEPLQNAWVREAFQVVPSSPFIAQHLMGETCGQEEAMYALHPEMVVAQFVTEKLLSGPLEHKPDTKRSLEGAREKKNAEKAVLGAALTHAEANEGDFDGALLKAVEAAAEIAKSPPEDFKPYLDHKGITADTAQKVESMVKTPGAGRVLSSTFRAVLQAKMSKGWYQDVLDKYAYDTAYEAHKRAEIQKPEFWAAVHKAAQLSEEDEAAALERKASFKAEGREVEYDKHEERQNYMLFEEVFARDKQLTEACETMAVGAQHSIALLMACGSFITLANLKVDGLVAQLKGKLDAAERDVVPDGQVHEALRIYGPEKISDSSAIGSAFLCDKTYKGDPLKASVDRRHEGMLRRTVVAVDFALNNPALAENKQRSAAEADIIKAYVAFYAVPHEGSRKPHKPIASSDAACGGGRSLLLALVQLCAASENGRSFIYSTTSTSTAQALTKLAEHLKNRSVGEVWTEVTQFFNSHLPQMRARSCGGGGCFDGKSEPNAKDLKEVQQLEPMESLLLDHLCATL